MQKPSEWKIHALVLAMVAVSEFIGIKSFQVGPGKAILLPMLYALVIGLMLGPKFLKVVDLEEMKLATPFIGLSVMLLIAKYGTTIGPSVPLLIKAGPALILQEIGNFGTIILAFPIAMLLGFRREAIGAVHSIAREGNLAIIGEMYGLESPEGRGVMGVYICGTLFGAIFFGIMAGFFASLKIFHPYALAMACGVGSASMMAASSGALTAAVPAMAKEIQAFASASNLLTAADGVYASVFVAIPFTEWLYRKFGPKEAAQAVAQAEPAAGQEGK
ncbi:DUF3100 domain-containing protein [Gelria sp. Kuro-4]|uniref:DUF3100 domain-containing protein n=1 Tax=Gelria sp. Kuro-4 TaxID=2796927 RepID=UPI001C80EC78|nr:DUF3100 domain-containing protein [Gelria sp. Kuro-4]MDI3523186.1 hypothetical protein [Bacillota bacterium]MDK2927465.1 hypothetical protein [Bacillota bacterium]